MTKFCVLGGGGSFGLHTSKYLLEEGHQVLGIGRAEPKQRCFSLGVGEGNGNYQYQALHVGNELDLLLEVLEDFKPQIVVNFAAQGEGAASWKHSWRYFDTNSTALVRLCEELSKRDFLERFIQIGTSEMYGSCEKPMREDAPIKPSSPYAASKVAFDLYLQSKNLDFPMNIIRPSNCYGPGQQLYRLIPRCIVSGLTGERLPLHGGGKSQKSYMHSSDLARAILVVSEKGKLGEIYNAGPLRPTSIREVVERCSKALNMRFEDLCEVTENRLGEDSCYWLDSSKLEELGWDRQVGWGRGLAGMVSWGQKYLEELRDLPRDFRMRA